MDPVDPIVKKDGKLLVSGFISPQSESHPIDFRKVALVDLPSVKNDRKKLNELVKMALK